jgi:hypothetical protein
MMIECGREAQRFHRLAEDAGQVTFVVQEVRVHVTAAGKSWLAERGIKVM